MGQKASQHEVPGVSRYSFTDAEYDALRKALDVVNDDPKARVDFAAFVARFPSHLRPLVQPIFFQLGNEQVGEHSAEWGTLVPNLSNLLRGRGMTWSELLQAWAASSGPGLAGPDPAAQDKASPSSGSASGKSGERTDEELELYLELATSLCFWCAYSESSPSPVSAEQDSELKGSDGDAQRMVSLLSASLASYRSSANLQNDAGANGMTTMTKWLESHIPLMPQAVGPRLDRALLGSSDSVLCQMPRIDSRILDPGLVLLLKSIDARIWESGNWAPLYRDWQDGRSFNALLKGALHYGGPALVVLKTDSGQILGALSTTWEEGHGKFAGGMECLLFGLLPTFTLCRSSSRSGNYVYLNSRNKHAPRGLGFGGQVDFCRLWLDVDFEDCFVLESDATYEPGLLLPSTGLQTRFQVSHIEVWGCGGEEALAAQAEARGRDESVRESARKVDRAKLIENDFDKEMFFSNTFSATAGSRHEREEDEKAADGGDAQ
eukprot:TRINITY_DN1578_c0_g1_i1.p1 TRINITY_DN1578_c0_g1~~TRINITY_DN1578_c0_g1_i1.p1  ORF type:complete len:492 (-),score=110.09 TRINITY_DN1578_c0_g1_i1:187-1662(-)